jgi:hypothetical protein
MKPGLDSPAKARLSPDFAACGLHKVALRGARALPVESARLSLLLAAARRCGMRFAIMLRCLPIAILLLAACGPADAPEDKRAERDPAIAGALGDPIMTDPDLATQNRGNSALQGGGPPIAELPPDKVGPEEIARATAAALDLAGGKMAALPVETAGVEGSRLAGKLTPRAIAAALPELTRGCGDRLEPGFIWAARLPATAPVYPRGHARQAAGSDSAGCRLRVVSYITPVPPGEVLTFYATTAGKAGVALALRREGEDMVLSGQGKGLELAVFARPFDQQLSEVVLITSER